MMRTLTLTALVAADIDFDIEDMMNEQARNWRQQQTAL